MDQNPNIMLRCCICGDTFQDPRILSCIHTFCLKCIEKVASDAPNYYGDWLPCPICTKRFMIPEEGCAGLQEDSFLKRLVDRFTSFTSSSKIATFCENCAWSSGEGTPDPELLCEDCRKHVCLVLEPDECRRHQRQLRLYCSDCDDVLCDECLQESHQKHRLMAARNRAITIGKEFETRVTGITKCESHILEKKAYLEQEENATTTKTDNLKREIIARREEIKDLVDLHANELLLKIESYQTYRRLEIGSVRQKDEVYLSSLNYLRKYWRQITTLGSPDDICKMAPFLKREADDLIKMNKPQLECQPSPYCMYLEKTNIDEFLDWEGLNLIGMLQDPDNPRIKRQSKNYEIKTLKAKIANLNAQLEQEKLLKERFKEDTSRLDQDLTNAQSTITAQQRKSKLALEEKMKETERLKADLESERQSHATLILSLNEKIKQLRAEVQKERNSNSSLTSKVEESERQIAKMYQMNEAAGPEFLGPLGYDAQETHRFNTVTREPAGSRSAFEITGFAILDDELFIASSHSSTFEVRNIKMNNMLKRRWKQDDISDPLDLVSCPTNNCLYVLSYKASMKSCAIFKLDKNGQLLIEWSVGGSTGRLSVASDSHIILTVQNENRIIEYTTNGLLMQTLNLFKYGIDFPWHAIKLNSRHFIVSHGNTHDILRGICIVDVLEGYVIRSCVQIRISKSLAVDKQGNILVSDWFYGRVLLLSPALEFMKVIVDYSVRRRNTLHPSNVHMEKICFSESNRCLLTEKKYEGQATNEIVCFSLS